jgi:hypothetical protein
MSTSYVPVVILSCRGSLTLFRYGRGMAAEIRYWTDPPLTGQVLRLQSSACSGGQE